MASWHVSHFIRTLATFLGKDTQHTLQDFWIIRVTWEFTPFQEDRLKVEGSSSHHVIVDPVIFTVLYQSEITARETTLRL